MISDVEGFVYPQIDASLCVRCGLCERVCPVLHPDEAREPLSVYAAKAKDDTLRLASSSGGVFSLLAQNVIRRGGLVFGAAFDHSDWHVYHRSVDNEADLAELRGSKYVQSDVGDCFQEVRAYLTSGREVLFSGTPCQIAGLKHFLSLSKEIPIEKLILVEVVCHAVPSPLVWRKYLERRIATVYKNGAGELSDIRRVSSRRKDCGWKRFAMFLGFADDTDYLSVFINDSYMRGFLVELYNRPSCHNCSAKRLQSGADLTIADYWNVHSRFPDIDDDMGTSLVLVNTEKGRRLFSSESSLMEICLSDFAHASQTNPAIISSSKPHKRRGAFFGNVNNMDFDALVEKCLRLSFCQRLRRIVGRLLRKTGAWK